MVLLIILFIVLIITPTVKQATIYARYVKNLSLRLEIDMAKARDIAGEVNQKVFQSVRTSLKKLHGLSGPEDEKKGLKPEIIMPAENKISIRPAAI